jgi:hypothetical protein
VTRRDATGRPRDTLSGGRVADSGLRDPRGKDLVEFLQHGSAGAGFYFVMEYCPGGNVEDLDNPG